MQILQKISAVLVFLISGCELVETEPVFTENLVVEALITSDKIPQQVILSKTSTYNADSLVFIRQARVSISDLNGQTYFFSDTVPGNPGVYLLTDWPGLEDGMKYVLNIELTEPVNGHSSFQAESVVYPINPIDSIRLKYHANWGTSGMYEVKCFYQDPPTTEFYMCNLLINSRLVTNTLPEKLVVEDKLFNGNYANGVLAGILDQSYPLKVLQSGDYVSLQLSTVDENFARFIQGVQEELNYDNPFFGSAASNVNSNINHGAIGYFCCTRVTYATVEAE